MNYIFISEPQPELLGYAEQTPAVLILIKQKNVRFFEPDVHKE